MTRKFHTIYLAFLLLLAGMPLEAQKSASYSNRNAEFQRGAELFEKQKYGAAREVFEAIIQSGELNGSMLCSEAYYYLAMSAIRLFHADAEFLVNELTTRYPESPRLNAVGFEMGRYYYSNKKYRDALDWFSRVQKEKLETDNLYEYWFKTGYSWFMRSEPDKARFAFSEIKDIDTKYTSPALYYYSHIAYQQQNYETALDGFKRLVDDATFAPVVPYYIIQILYLQGKFDELISYAPGVVDKVSEKRLPEVARLTGDAYYRKSMYSEAIPFLEKFRDKTPSLSTEDKYVLAYCYYKAGRYEDACSSFESITDQRSDVQQNAMYHLADCYIRLQQKNKARIAFAAASRLDTDPSVTEDALFNYAKLTYELAYSPFNEAIRSFNEYISRYPASKRIDEAYNYLVQVYTNTRNYKDALESINKIRIKDERILKAWQRVAYFRALELYNNLDLEGAMRLLDVSLNQGNYDQELKALAWYWKGEASYRTGEYDAALEYYRQFMAVPAAQKTEVYPAVNYNLGYCFFNQKRYSDAATWFFNYVSLVKNPRISTVADAYNRLGDCAFVRTEYLQAADYYTKAINLNKYDTDYAIFQKGFVMGLLEKNDSRIALMNQLLAEFPGSSYVDDALFELGNSFLKMQDQQKALRYYKKVLDEYKGSSYVKKALVQCGLIYRNLDRNVEALDAYKQVIGQYPGSPEARSALLAIQNVYVDMGDDEGYVAYVRSLGSQADVSTATLDSVTYRTAENLYLASNFERAGEGFRKYIDRYPEGNFILNAQFYKGDCDYRAKNFDEALKSFNYVVGKPRSMFTEEALLGASRINFSNGNFADAVMNYKMLESLAELKSNLLEARLGLMRANYRMNDCLQTIEAADKVLSSEKLPDYLQREARFSLAKCSQALGKTDQALEQYRKLAAEVKSVEGAESKYHIAEIFYERAQYDKAEKEVFDFIDKNTPHQYWMARGFILLADVYVKKKDQFQALQTLQSVLDYYELKDDGIIAMAKDRKAVIEGVKPTTPAAAEDTFELKMDTK